MKRLAVLAGFVLFAAFPALVPAHAEPPRPTVQTATDADARRAMASELAALMDLTGSVESWKRSLNASQDFSQCGCQIAKELQVKLKESWQKAVSEEFNTKEIVAVLERASGEMLTLAELKQAVSFRKSQLGLKTTAAETAHRNSQTGASQSMQRMAAAQKALDANLSRKANLKTIIAMTGGAQSVTNAMINISIGTAMGASALAPQDQARLSDSEIVDMIEASRPQMEASLSKMMLPIYGSLYATLSDDEVRALAKELSKPAARKLNDVMDTAFNAAMRAQALKMGRRFAQEMQGEKI